MHARLFTGWSFCGIPQNGQPVNNPRCSLLQGEGHKVWGNAPKKSNSATCAHFIKICIYT